MAGLCEGGNEPPGSLKATFINQQQLDILAGIIKNEDLMQEFQIEPIMQFISKYQFQWKGHLERMNRCRIPKALFHYHPYGKRSLGRPKKRWTENSSLRP
ncbi:hypothetical protein ANN_21923 [Periplaneta americana]|uniref:Uncharacterized protein n=1 Tax=Periplaneta americana TaxID=6978 RepID=A0ABQ8S6Q4_PERAM|nr:hypothetical protein ANN_21923 [Periplaneta americana]